MATVYFSKDISSDSIRQLAQTVLDELPLSSPTAIKTHFGEKGNSRFVAPENIHPVVKLLQDKQPFVTDTNTLYRGKRINATDHIELAKEHGFGSLGIPIVIADGEHGDDEVKVPVDGNHFKEVMIAKGIQEIPSMAVISHFKGHVLFGFGGALKNLGMGCGSRAGKLAMHSKIEPVIGDDCIGCGVCADNCAVGAIDINDKAHINENCIGCAKCISVCPYGTIRVPFHGATSDEAQERCAEYAAGALKGKTCVYLTFINNVTKDCDCLSDSKIIADDIGVLASTDPVAIDQAAYDLLKKANGTDVFQDVNGVDGTHILLHAEKMGVGSRDYEQKTL
ncbi:MAG: DUF362 domain-containing protein [Nanobdellota archaeon]